jgi:hypothetical protein
VCKYPLSGVLFYVFLTVRGVHHGVYRQPPAIQQLQQYVCLQLQFRSPLVEAIGKRANIPLPLLGLVSSGTQTHTILPTAALFCHELHIKSKLFF